MLTCKESDGPHGGRMKQAGRSWTGIRYLHRHHGVLALKIRRGAETGVKAGFPALSLPGHK